MYEKNRRNMKKLSNIINTKAYMEKFTGYHVPNYTQTPNEIFDKFLSKLSHAEMKVLLYIVRRTFGFHKEYKGDAISLSQICRGIIKKDKETGETKVLDEGTGLSKKSAILAIKNLEGKGHIIVWRGRITKAGDKDSNWYRLNLKTEK